MRLGLAISMFLHAALLAWALVTFADPRAFKVPEPEPVAADVITESQLVLLRQGSRDAKLDDAMAKDVLKPDEAKKDTPKPKPVLAAATPPPPPVEPETKPPEPEKPVEPPPAAAPKLETAALDEKIEKDALEEMILAEKRKADAAAKAKAEADAKAKADADAKAKAKAKALADAKAKALAKAKADAKAKAIADAKAKAQIDSARLSELIDKAPDPKQAAAAAPTPTKATTVKGPVKGERDGTASSLSGPKADRLGALINETFSSQWDISCGTDGVEKIIVKVAVAFRPDGSMAQAPRVTNPMGGELFALMANAALRAVQKAQPITFPADLYKGGWDDFTIRFDARERCRQ